MVVHVARNGDNHTIALTLRLIANLFQLAADQVGGTQMLKTLIGQRIGSEVRPVMVVNTAWLDARIFECGISGRQPIIFKQRESRFAIQHRILIEDGDTGIVNVSGE